MADHVFTGARCQHYRTLTRHYFPIRVRMFSISVITALILSIVRSKGAEVFISTPASISKSTGYLVLPEARKRSEEHTSELQSRENLVCRLLLEKKNILVRDNEHVKAK